MAKPRAKNLLPQQCPCEVAAGRQVEDTHAFKIVDAAVDELAKLVSYDDKECPPRVFETLVQLLVIYPCHNCNKNSIKRMLSWVCTLKLDFITMDFLINAVINVRLNSDKLDWSIVHYIVVIIANFIWAQPTEVDKHNLIVDIRLLPMIRMLVSSCAATGQTGCFKCLGKMVLDLFTLVIQTQSFEPDEQLSGDLIKCFGYRPIEVYDIVCFTLKSIRSYEKYCMFWDDFARGVHETYRHLWQSNTLFASLYLVVLTRFEKDLRRQRGFRSGYHDKSQRWRNTKAAVEVFRRVCCIPDREMAVFLTQERPNMASVAAIRMLCEKVSAISSNTIFDKLHHHPCLVENETTRRFSDRLLNTNYDKSIHLSFLNCVTEIIAARIYERRYFDDVTVKALVTSANYDYINCQQSYQRVIGDIAYSSTRHTSRYGTVFLKGGIAQAVWAVIDTLHKKCVLCQDIIELMHDMLKSITPELLTIITELNQTRNVKLAVTLPFVVLEKENVIKAMYLDGFDLLTKQLAKGENVESLHMLARICRPQPPDKWLTESWTMDRQVNHDETNTGEEPLALAIMKLIEKIGKLLAGKQPARLLCEKILTWLPSACRFHVNFFKRFLSLATGPPLPHKINFDMDIAQHMDLITLCHNLFMPQLGDLVVDSLRWHRMEVKRCAGIYHHALFFGLPSLRKACIDFALFGDIENPPRKESLQNLFQNVDNKLLAADFKEWFQDECANYPNLDVELDQARGQVPASGGPPLDFIHQRYFRH